MLASWSSRNPARREKEPGDAPPARVQVVSDGRWLARVGEGDPFRGLQQPSGIFKGQIPAVATHPMPSKGDRVVVQLPGFVGSHAQTGDAMQVPD